MALSRLPAALLVVALLTTAGCGKPDATGPKPVAVDNKAPFIVWFVGPNQPVSVRAEIPLHFRVEDSVGVTRGTLTVSGAFDLSFEFDFPELGRPNQEWTLRLRAPDVVDVQQLGLVTLTVSDAAGNTSGEAQAAFTLVDDRGPKAWLELGGLRADGTIRTGESLDLYVTASDNYRLTWIGYEGAGLRDSVLASGIGDSHTFSLTVPPSWRTKRPTFTAWARDAMGYGSAIDDYSKQAIPVYEWTDRSVQVFPLPREEGWTRMLWDAKRNAIYRLLYNPGGTGTSSRLDGVSVATGQVLPSITLPKFAQTMSFSASGDSLLLTFEDQRALGIVDLSSPVPALTMLPLQYPSEVSQFGAAFASPRSTFATGNRIYVALHYPWYTSRLLELNLATGEQVVRTDIDVPTHAQLMALPDGRLFLSPSGYNLFVDHLLLYSPATNTFSTTDKLRPADEWQYSASPSGRFMLVNAVYSASLDTVAVVETFDWKSGSWPPVGPAALSADGEVVYLTTHYGYEKVRLSDGALLEQVKLGMKPGFVVATPDGTRLIAVGESSVMVVDLR